MPKILEYGKRWDFMSWIVINVWFTSKKNALSVCLQGRYGVEMIGLMCSLYKGADLQTPPPSKL